MRTTIDFPHELVLQLLAGEDDRVLHEERATAGVAALVEEAFLAAVLAERLPPDPERLDVRVVPVITTALSAGGVADGLIVELEAGPDGRDRAAFERGPWTRRAEACAAALAHRSVGAAAAESPDSSESPSTPWSPGSPPSPGARAAPRARLLVRPGGAGAGALALPPLGAPPVDPLDPEVARALLEGPSGAGALDADRPILIADEVEAQVLAATVEAGPAEIGGVALGRLVRLPRPLPGARTRVVTLLTKALLDARHVGVPGRLDFDPGALVEAAWTAERRGRGESVLAIVHSHGWGRGCDDCNASAACALPEARHVSLDDYRVAESLLPGKATVFPVAGRRLGAPGRRPLLEVHAWRRGELRPLPWRRFRSDRLLALPV